MSSHRSQTGAQRSSPLYTPHHPYARPSADRRQASSATRRAKPLTSIERDIAEHLADLKRYGDLEASASARSGSPVASRTPTRKRKSSDDFDTPVQKRMRTCDVTMALTVPSTPTSTRFSTLSQFLSPALTGSTSPSDSTPPSTPPQTPTKPQTTESGEHTVSPRKIKQKKALLKNLKARRSTAHRTPELPAGFVAQVTFPTPVSTPSASTTEHQVEASGAAPTAQLITGLLGDWTAVTLRSTEDFQPTHTTPKPSAGGPRRIRSRIFRAPATAAGLPASIRHGRIGRRMLAARRAAHPPSSRIARTDPFHDLPHSTEGQVTGVEHRCPDVVGQVAEASRAGLTAQQHIALRGLGIHGIGDVFTPGGLLLDQSGDVTMCEVAASDHGMDVDEEVGWSIGSVQCGGATDVPDPAARKEAFDDIARKIHKGKLHVEQYNLLDLINTLLHHEPEAMVDGTPQEIYERLERVLEVPIDPTTYIAPRNIDGDCEGCERCHEYADVGIDGRK